MSLKPGSREILALLDSWCTWRAGVLEGVTSERFLFKFEKVELMLLIRECIFELGDGSIDFSISCSAAAPAI